MFPRLGHDAFVCRNDQHDKVHSCRASHHVFDKALMARHIHDAQPLAAGKINPGEAKFNGDSPAFFFLQAITVDACKRPYQRSFAVIYMPCRA